MGSPELHDAGDFGGTAPQLDYDREPRFDELQNSMISSAGGAQLITPDLRAIDQIAAETNGRAVYFPLQDRPGFEASRAGAIGEPEFATWVTRPFIQMLLSQYPTTQLGLRAVVTSINGTMPPMKHDDHKILDIAQVVERGVERPTRIFNVAGLPNDVDLEGALISVNRVNQYAHQVGFARRWWIPQPNTAAIFPAVLVYDFAGLKPDGVRGYEMSFRNDGVSPLLAAYVVDCPTR